MHALKHPSDRTLRRYSRCCGAAVCSRHQQPLQGHCIHHACSEAPISLHPATLQPMLWRCSRRRTRQAAAARRSRARLCSGWFPCLRRWMTWTAQAPPSSACWTRPGTASSSGVPSLAPWPCMCTRKPMGLSMAVSSCAASQLRDVLMPAAACAAYAHLLLKARVFCACDGSLQSCIGFLLCQMQSLKNMQGGA